MKRASSLLGLVVLCACRGPVGSQLPSSATDDARRSARACDRGDPHACTNVAADLFEGRFGNPDLDAAREIWLDACHKGALLACVRAAELVNDHEAEALLEGSCPAEPLACLRLGELLVASSVEEAFIAFSMACDHGLLRGCVAQGIAMREGQGTPLSADRAHDLFVRACGDGAPGACREQARAMRRPDSENRFTDRAMDLLHGACADHDAEACGMIAQHMEHSPTPQDREVAADFWRQACVRGLETACGP